MTELVQRARRAQIVRLGLAFVPIFALAQQPTVTAADATGVRAWTFELEQSRPYAPPYLARFERNGQSLSYLAARHVSTQAQQDVLEHPTLRSIRSLLEQEAFDLVLIEGLAPGQEASASLLEKAKDCERQSYRTGCGEAFFLVNAARQRGILYQSVEPWPSQIREMLAPQGFSIHDLLGYYLVRQIPQMRRQATLDAVRFRSDAQSLLDQWRRGLGVSEPFALEQFEAWYKRHMPVPANYLDVTADDSAPYGAVVANHAQRISAAVNRVRDQNAVRQVQAAFAQHRRILLVMGSSHLLTQLPMLRFQLGEPSYRKLF